MRRMHPTTTGRATNHTHTPCPSINDRSLTLRDLPLRHVAPYQRRAPPMAPPAVATRDRCRWQREGVEGLRRRQEEGTGRRWCYCYRQCRDEKEAGPACPCPCGRCCCGYCCCCCCLPCPMRLLILALRRDDGTHPFLSWSSTILFVVCDCEYLSLFIFIFNINSLGLAPADVGYQTSLNARPAPASLSASAARLSHEQRQRFFAATNLLAPTAKFDRVDRIMGIDALCRALFPRQMVTRARSLSLLATSWPFEPRA